MNEEQRNLCRDLTIYPNGLRRITKEDFLHKFPSSIERGKLALGLLEEACRTRSKEELECALTIGFTFGFAAEQRRVLCELVEANWHVSHEDVVSALDQLRTPDALEALFRATQWVPKYLEYDDSRAFAVKAIWAIGQIPGPEAEAKLDALAHSDNAILKRKAAEQLERRHRAA